jgi:hypothetical protein
MVKQNKVIELALDDLVRHQFSLVMDMQARGQLGRDDPLFICAHELVKRFNAPE